jgi:DNA-binding LacI/PurR family transcriptional regulator
MILSGQESTMKPADSRSGRRMNAQQITRVIRGWIVEGRYGPGERVPDREACIAEFGASNKTVQKAFDRLIMEGFVRPRGRLGTFVTDRPPHLHRVAMVFRETPAKSRFWLTLEQAALEVVRTKGMDLTIFVVRDEESREHARLLEAVRTRTLSGMIVANPTEEFRTLPLLQSPGVPVVGISARPMPPHTRVVYPDSAAFVTRAMKYFAERKRTRVAMLVAMKPPDSDVYVPRLMKAHGIRPWLMQFGDPNNPMAVRHQMRLMMRMRRQDRPNALIIQDDNVAEAATTALAEEKVRIPDDLEVICHCNFPNPPPCFVPVVRLGFDCREIVEWCLRALRLPRQESATDEVELLPPRFEHELVRSGGFEHKEASDWRLG